MTATDVNINTEGYEKDVQESAARLSLEFQRDSRRYCRRLDCEVEE